MSLLEDLKSLVNTSRNEYAFEDEAEGKFGAVKVKSEHLDSTRWGDIYEDVYERDNEFVAVSYETGSTEYQEMDFEPDLYEVIPVSVTVTKYERV